MRHHVALQLPITNNEHTAMALPPNTALVLTIPAGTLRFCYVYRATATARQLAKWYVYGGTGWLYGSVAGGVRQRRALGEAPTLLPASRARPPAPLAYAPTRYRPPGLFLRCNQGEKQIHKFKGILRALVAC
jgi:hypothetical protein